MPLPDIVSEFYSIQDHIIASLLLDQTSHPLLNTLPDSPTTHLNTFCSPHTPLLGSDDDQLLPPVFSTTCPFREEGTGFNIFVGEDVRMRFQVGGVDYLGEIIGWIGPYASGCCVVGVCGYLREREGRRDEFVRCFVQGSHNTRWGKGGYWMSEWCKQDRE